MSLLAALTSFPVPSYTHPISTPSTISSRLNPYLPLPPHSTLFTNPTYMPSLPTPGAGSVIHVLNANATSITRSSVKNSLVLISRTAQEGHDHALLALRLSKEGTIVYHFVGERAMDGEVERLADVEGWLRSASVNGLASWNVDGDERKEEVDLEATTVHAYETASLSLLKSTRRAQRAFIHHSAGSSSRLIINFLPRSLEVDNVLDISLASPLPREKIRHAVKGAETVIVVEGGSSRFGQAWASIVDVLDGMDFPIRSILVASDDLSGFPAALEDTAPITRLGEPESTPGIPSNSITVPTAESTYTTLLSSSPSPLEILNDPSSLSANESTSPLYAFGKAVALRAARDRLIGLAKTVLRAPHTRQDLHEALAAWLLDGTEAAGQKVESAIGEGASGEEAEILKLGQEGLWAKKNLWIVISNSWAQDLASSGLHHALASGLDINLLVYETSPSPFSPLAQKSTKERKKDLALYALNMGDVYVASVAVFADYAGVIGTMREAESYSGPGLVLAYLPWGEKEDGEDVGFGEKAGPLERLRETKRAVSGGWWPMFRFNPSLSDEKKFTLDSPHIKQALTEFLDRQSHLSQLTRATPSISSSITKSLGTDLVSARKDKARRAYDALINSLDGPGLLVLFASDGGNAEKVAKRLVSRAKMRGVGASIKVLDEIAGSIKESLAGERNVVVITSTAGQGEMPQNGREFTKALSKLLSTTATTTDTNTTTDTSSASTPESTPDSTPPSTPDSLSETKLSVFGMGDSNYWPRKEDYIYYNKSAKDLHPKLTSLGVSELAPMGLGDDSDPDGYQTGYKPWESALWRGLGVDGVEVSDAAQEETVANEHMKIASDYLRGTILEGLEDGSTGAIGASDAQLTKFHGTYLQDDRDIRDSLKAQGLEPAYAFMIRCRLPGGVVTPAQWLAIDRIADEHGNSTFKITTRQTFQFHGIIKKHLKPAMQSINKGLMDTIAACGDVNRNVQCTVNPSLSHTHATVYAFAKGLSEHLLPRTSAYHEIWLDKKQIAGGEVGDMEPMYGPTYLPRKFKMAVAVPPDNAVDVFTNDVGWIAIIENDEVVGYNVTVGGGMGVTHSNKKTYPRLGDVVGFVRPEDGNKVAESIMLVQRDNGNRADRKNARLKYTIDRMTLPVFVSEVEERWGHSFSPARPYTFTSNIDNYGWTQGRDGNYHFTVFIENGRIEDSVRHQFKSGLREIATVHKGDFRLTANQHVVISDIRPEDKEEIGRIMGKWGLDNLGQSGLRLSSSACVAFPSCSLAFAEAERYLPVLISKLEQITEEAGIRSDAITVRMTGCANGCARPWNAEVALVGKAPGSYLMMLGGSPIGTRLAKPYKSSITEPEILAILGPLIKQWALEREEGEPFGDYVIRTGVIKETTHGTNFWEETDAL